MLCVVTCHKLEIKNLPKESSNVSKVEEIVLSFERGQEEGAELAVHLNSYLHQVFCHFLHTSSGGHR